MVGLLALALALACQPESEPAPPESASATATGAPEPAPPPAVAPAPTPPRRDRLTLVAGGDVSLGRTLGQRLLREPDRDDFANLRPLLAAAHLRFVNLECPLSEQGGETVRPGSPLVFTGPPVGADALARAGIDVVSLANNHAWDYGKDALFETFGHLERVGVAFVGAGRTRAESYGPTVIERDGFKVAFVAVTAIWNQPWSPHPGADHIADAQRASLVASVQQARAIDGVDKVIVSHHGGYEYVDTPHEGTRALLRAAVEAGADAVIGHHPHVIQRIELVDGKPIFYSLGNLLMQMVTGQPWTYFGMLARLRLARGGPTEIEVCPFRIFGLEPIPLAGDPQRQAMQAHFEARFRALLGAGALVQPGSATELGPFGDDGCAPVRARP